MTLWFCFIKDSYSMLVGLFKSLINLEAVFKSKSPKHKFVNFRLLTSVPSLAQGRFVSKVIGIYCHYILVNSCFSLRCQYFFYCVRHFKQVGLFKANKLKLNGGDFRMSVDVYVALSYLRLTIPQKDPLHNQNYTNDHFLPICVLLASSSFLL